MSTPPDNLAALMSHLAHELRTPLSAAQGYLRMLSGGRYGELTEGQAHAIAASTRCCEQLSALAEQLSLLGRLERGELTLTRTAVSLEALLAQVAASHEPLPDHPVRVACAAPETPGLSVRADAAYLRRTLTTLLAAVIRTAPDESTVILTARLVANRGAIAIAPADRVEALLALDEAALDPLNDYEGGLGLSLPLARRLTAAQSGRVGTARTDGVLAVRLTLPLSS